MKKHIAVINIPAYGHVNPTLAVVRELVNRGHRVTYVTTEEFVPTIETLREAVQHAAHDEELFTRVTDMQQKVREAGGAVTAAQAIEACLRDS
jgi:UDP:flavonoid glycosyltransferase YjiC (YdhE family)